MAATNLMTKTAEGKAIPGAWMGNEEERAKEALKPFRSLALCLGSESDVSIEGPDLTDVGVVVQALVERAEMILGIPDGSF